MAEERLRTNVAGKGDVGGDEKAVETLFIADTGDVAGELVVKGVAPLAHFSYCCLRCR